MIHPKLPIERSSNGNAEDGLVDGARGIPIDVSMTISNMDSSNDALRVYKKTCAYMLDTTPRTDTYDTLLAIHRAFVGSRRQGWPDGR